MRRTSGHHFKALVDKVSEEVALGRKNEFVCYKDTFTEVKKLLGMFLVLLESALTASWCQRRSGSSLYGRRLAAHNRLLLVLLRICRILGTVLALDMVGENHFRI